MLYFICAMAAVLLLRILYIVFIHETIFPLSRYERQTLLRNGAFHYTSAEAAEKILKSGQIEGSPDHKSIFKSGREKNVIWLLINSDRRYYRRHRKSTVRRHCPVHPTGVKKTVRYEVKLQITGFREEDIKKMRRNLEGSVGYRGDVIRTVKIEAAQPDEDDRALGIFDIDETSGVDGFPGADGFYGADGFSGADGFYGADGLSGADGFYGADGLSGTDGFYGADGLSGTDGFSGADIRQKGEE